MLFATLISLFVTLAIVWIGNWLYTWAHPKCNGKLPPGSTGFPLLGEALQFFSPYTINGIQPFIKKRMERYGLIFRTNLLGQNFIVLAHDENNQNILHQENKSFLVSYTESFVRIMGRKSMVTLHGAFHKYLRNLVLSLIGPENLKDIIHEIDQSTRHHLHSWASIGNVDVKESVADMTFEFFARKMMSYEEHNKKGKRLRDDFKAFIEGLVSFPVNIPGTAYNRCIKGRNNLIKVIKGTIEERKTTKTAPKNDFLDTLLEEARKEDSILKEGVIEDLILLLLFASHETTSMAMTAGVKFVAEHPQVLAELMKEHEAIIENREDKDATMTWKEYKSMSFTHMIINETLRLVNIVPVMFRKVLVDVEINGYTVPKDWMVMVVPPLVHLDESKYENPLEFNPWRWKDRDLHVGSKTFMAFGGGSRLCAGADFAKVQMAIFLHHLVINHKWSIVKGGDIVRIPALTFPNGLHIQISEKDN